MNSNNTPSSGNAWDDLDLADTQFEQAEEATIRMARLCRVFYQALTDQNGIPAQIAAPLLVAYVQNLIMAGVKQRNKKPE